MKLIRSFLLFALALCAAPGRAEVASQPGTPEPDHTVWVKIVSSPPGAEVYAVPKSPAAPRVRIGTAPCMVAVDLRWGRQWLKKRWSLVDVKSPGNVCRAEMQKGADFSLAFRVAVEKEGYETKTVEASAAVLKYPGPDWSGMDRWPTAGELVVELAPLQAAPAPKAEPATAGNPAQAGEPANPPAASRPVQPAVTRKVVLAGGAMAGSGTLTVQASVDGADVFVNEKFLGGAPVQAVLPEGFHDIEVQKVGYRSVRKRLHVSADAEVSYRAVLTP